MSFIGQTSLSSTIDIVLENFPCDSSVIITDWVIVSSSVAYKGSASDLNQSNILGLVEFKSTSTLCNIRVSGISLPIFSGLDETKEYLLSVSPGEMTLVAPNASGQVVLKLGQPIDSQRFFVVKGNRIKRS